MNQQTAYEHHQAGRYADAARIYQSLLDWNPNDVAVLHLYGVMHHQCGWHERAVELINRAIELNPQVAAFHANLAEALRSLKRPEQAAESCRKALSLQPDYPEALNNLGLALHELGQDEEALTHFDAALKLRPEFASVENNRGTSLLALKKNDQALEAYRKAIKLDPKLALAQANLGQMLVDREQAAEGLVHCQEAVRLQPNLPAAQNNLGNALRAMRRWEEARVAYAEAASLDPKLAVAIANLGLTLQLEGKVAAAIPHFRRAVEISPDDPLLREQLAVACSLDDDWPEAIVHCLRRVELKPEDADAYCALGWAYHSDSRPVEAETAYRRALELVPEHIDAWLNLGSLHEEHGAMAEAEVCYRKAEELNPSAPLPLARRAMLLRGKLSDEDRDRMRFKLYGLLTPLVRMNLLYALAHVADSRGDYAEAAACLQLGNSLAREQRRGLGHTYDADEHSRYVDHLIAGFTPALFERLGDAGDPDTRPVFIFGLPRSGTTLVEQILASHSQVFGAGELPYVRRAFEALPPVPDRPQDLEACLEKLDSDALLKAGQSYKDGVKIQLERHAKSSNPVRIVDKMPDNYLYLGLIALMFPKATLIHVRRDVRDIAVSCWQTHFRSIRWADDPDTLVRRFQDKQRLMEHWVRVLPRTIHEVQYEHLVNDFEPEARRLISICGLEWEPACLEFHQTSRPVRTASVTQVRQPLYRKSLERWRSYEPHMKDIFDRLVPPENQSQTI